MRRKWSCLRLVRFAVLTVAVLFFASYLSAIKWKSN